MTAEERQEQLTLAKYCAMKAEATAFYSRPGQSWKNIMSFGDMPYEPQLNSGVLFQTLHMFLFNRFWTSQRKLQLCVDKHIEIKSSVHIHQNFGRVHTGMGNQHLCRV